MSGIDGEWDAVDADLPQVVARLLDVIGAVYLPFLVANAAALERNEAMVRFEAIGLPFEQGVFKYQAKCLADLRARYAALDGAARRQVDPALDASGCLPMLVTS